VLALAVHRVGDRLQLQLRVLDRLEVRRRLGRQLAAVLAAVLLQLLLRLDQLAARVLELRVQELVRVLGEVLAVADVLLDEQRRQALGHLLRRLRIVADVADAEGRVAFGDRRDVDVAPHPLHDVLHHFRPAQALVEPEVGDDALEPRAAQNLLVDRRQPLLDRRRHRRLHVRVGHALRHDHDQRFRPVLVDELVRHPRGRRGAQDHQAGDLPPAPRQQADEVFG
jgi:hypothetical protein